METVSVKCTIEPNTELNRQLVIAALDAIGYDGFEETEEGVTAYISRHRFDAGALDASDALQRVDADITWSSETIPEQDWNKVWEENYFKPIVISDKCIIRSQFHKDTPALPYEIIINPKMAFGTGHHETTRLMIKQMLTMDFKGKAVLDMGTGTGVLAVLSKMLGAVDTLAVDVDEWAYNNALENIQINKRDDIRVKMGDASTIQGHTFDIILANINFPVIKADIAAYAGALNKGGSLLLSGFYKDSLPVLTELAGKNSLLLQRTDELNEWMVVWYTKA